MATPDDSIRSFQVGSSVTLYAYTGNSNPAALDAGATWAITTGTAVTISGAGPSSSCTVTASAAGDAQVTCTGTNGTTFVTSFGVIPVPSNISQIRVVQGKLNARSASLGLLVGSTRTVTASQIPANGGTPLADTAASWSTSNAGVVTVSTTGPSATCTLTGVATGAATVTCTGSAGDVTNIAVNVGAQSTGINFS